MEFREVKYAPGYHAKMVGELRKDRANRSDSSYVGQESGVHGGRRKYAVPLLCLPGARCYATVGRSSHTRLVSLTQPGNT